MERAQVKEKLKRMISRFLTRRAVRRADIIDWGPLNGPPAGLFTDTGPESLFQEAYYRAMYPGYGEGVPLEHYRKIGWREGKNPNPYLYSNWYMEKYPEAAASGLSPLDHYYQFGAAQGYDPSPRFSTRAYEALYPEIGGGGGGGESPGLLFRGRPGGRPSAGLENHGR